MNNYQASPPPPAGYWLEHQPSAASRSKSRAKGELRAVDEFVVQVQTAYDATVRMEPDTAKRAEAYRNKPNADWAEQFIYFPDDFLEDWQDWEKIAPNDENLRQYVLRQVEALLAKAGVDLNEPGGEGI